MLDQGSYILNKVENASDSAHFGVRNVEHTVKSLIRQISFQLTILLAMIQTSNHVLHLTLRQWQTFLKSSHKWMGNFVLDEGAVDDYG